MTDHAETLEPIKALLDRPLWPDEFRSMKIAKVRRMLEDACGAKLSDVDFRSYVLALSGRAFADPIGSSGCLTKYPMSFVDYLDITLNKRSRHIFIRNLIFKVRSVAAKNNSTMREACLLVVNDAYASRSMPLNRRLQSKMVKWLCELCEKEKKYRVQETFDPKYKPLRLAQPYLVKKFVVYPAVLPTHPPISFTTNLGVMKFPTSVARNDRN